MKKKRVGPPSNVSKPKTPRRNEASLEREEIRAKEEKNDVMKMLTKNNRAPMFMNKIKIKKEDIKKSKAP